MADVVERLKDNYAKVALWPENRMSPEGIEALGPGFNDLLVLRNIVPDAIAEIEALRARLSQAGAGGGVVDAAKGIVTAWEALPGGRSYGPRVVEEWLVDRMKPAIDALRVRLAEFEARGAGDGGVVVKRIAEVASAVGFQAGVGASETAGLIVSVLAANPEQIDRFMADGSELFIDGTMRAENGCLSHQAVNGKVVNPTKLREMKGQSQ